MRDEIKMENWPEYFKGFSKRNLGRSTKLDVFGEIGAQREEHERGRGRVQYAAHDDRRRLDLAHARRGAVAGVVRPRDLQRLHVRAIDLIERRPARLSRLAAGHAPVLIGGAIGRRVSSARCGKGRDDHEGRRAQSNSSWVHERSEGVTQL